MLCCMSEAQWKLYWKNFTNIYKLNSNEKLKINYNHVQENPMISNIDIPSDWEDINQSTPN